MGTNTGLGIGIGIPFKNNALGGDKPYFPPELKARMIGVWTSYGKKNTDADRNIIKNKIPNAGGDLEILNAAYKLNSGFGKYSEDFTTWTKSSKITSVDSESFDFISNVNWNLLYYKSNIGKDIPSFKVHIKLKGEGKVFYNYITSEGVFTNKVITSEEYVVPISYNTKYTGETPVNCGFSIGITSEECSGTITQIPSFEGAFVTDGIDDTIISTKTLAEMGITNEVTVVSMIHQISLNPTYNNGFTNYIENLDKSTYVRNNIYKAGKTGIYGYSASLTSRTYSDINNILGDKKDYGTEIVNRQNTLDYTKFSVVGRASSIGEVSSIAWYWTIIANKVLTSDQINQVIAYYNLDRCVEPTVLYDVKRQGLSNDTPDSDWYLKDYSGNGYDMTLYNYAKTPESGINEGGGLQSDGVNDYGQFVGDLGLKDYTLIMNRAYNNLINNQVPLVSSNIVEDQTPFIVEHWNTDSNAISFSYGASHTTDIPLDINKKIVYQSTYSYMGYVIPKGDAISTGNGITLGKFGNGVQYSAICLWSLMLFPYSMSEFLIERQLKKHKLGTLYPDMVEFRPVIKANANYKITYYQIDSTNTWKSIKVGDYIVIGAKLAFQITFDNDASELKEVVSPQLSGIIVEKRPSNPGYNIYSYITSKSPQKINITIDEYIRYEDIV